MGVHYIPPESLEEVETAIAELLAKAVISIEEEGYIKIKALKYNVATGKLVVVKKAE